MRYNRQAARANCLQCCRKLFRSQTSARKPSFPKLTPKHGQVGASAIQRAARRMEPSPPRTTTRSTCGNLQLSRMVGLEVNENQFAMLLHGLDDWLRRSARSRSGCVVRSKANRSALVTGRPREGQHCLLAAATFGRDQPHVAAVRLRDRCAAMPNGIQPQIGKQFGSFRMFEKRSGIPRRRT